MGPQKRKSNNKINNNNNKINSNNNSPFFLTFVPPPQYNTRVLKVPSIAASSLRSAFACASLALMSVTT